MLTQLRRGHHRERAEPWGYRTFSSISIIITKDSCAWRERCDTRSMRSHPPTLHDAVMRPHATPPCPSPAHTRARAEGLTEGHYRGPHGCHTATATAPPTPRPSALELRAAARGRASQPTRHEQAREPRAKSPCANSRTTRPCSSCGWGSCTAGHRRCRPSRPSRPRR